MARELGDQVSALFPQEKAEPAQVDYQRKYELIVAYVQGVADVASDDVSATQATDAILSYIEQLNKR